MEVTDAFSVVVDCESAPAASVDAADGFDAPATAEGNGVGVVAVTARSIDPLTDEPTVLADASTLSSGAAVAAFTFDSAGVAAATKPPGPPLATDGRAFVLATPAFAGAAAVAALATLAATNFAAAAFVCAAFSAAAFKASAALAFADTAFVATAEAFPATGLAADALLTGLDAGLDAGLEVDWGADWDVALGAADLVPVLAAGAFAAVFSAALPVRAVLFTAVLTAVLPRDAADFAGTTRAVALWLAAFEVTAFAIVLVRAVERVALWLAALAAALTVRAGACAVFLLAALTRAVVAVLPLPAVALLEASHVVRLTAACFDAFVSSGFTPRLADWALFLALFVDMRSTLLIASAAKAAGAEPEGQRRRTNLKVAGVTMETSESTRGSPIRQTPAICTR